jgi:hypothetical protein
VRGRRVHDRPSLRGHRMALARDGRSISCTCVPLPHGQGALRPTFAIRRIYVRYGTSSIGLLKPQGAKESSRVRVRPSWIGGPNGVAVRRVGPSESPNGAVGDSQVEPEIAIRGSGVRAGSYRHVGQPARDRSGNASAPAPLERRSPPVRPQPHCSSIVQHPPPGQRPPVGTDSDGPMDHPNKALTDHG